MKNQHIFALAALFCLYFPLTAQRLDLSYAQNGLYIDGVAGSYYANPQASRLPDGSMLVVHEYRLNDVTSHANGQYLIRLRPDGKLDKSFGDDGNVWHSIQHHKGEGRYCVIPKTRIQKDGKILAALNYTETSRGRSEGVLARFMPDGSLDQSFGQGGLYNVDIGGYSQLRDIETYPNGDILLIGDAEIEPPQQRTTYKGLLLRLNSAGKPVSSFGNKGVAFYDFDDSNPYGQVHVENMFDAVVLADQKILVWAGFQSQHLGTSQQLIRFTAQGKADASFGAQGTKEVRLPIFDNHKRWGGDMKLMPDGKIYVCGFIWWDKSREGKHHCSPLVARFNTDGTFDRSFGENGALMVKASSEKIYTLDLLLQEDKKIVLLTSSLSGRATLSRVNYDGSSDASYGTSQSTPAGMESMGLFWGEKGSIYVYGAYHYESKKTSHIAFCRFHHNGKPQMDDHEQPQPAPQPNPTPNPQPVPEDNDVVEEPIQMRTFLHTKTTEQNFRMTLRYTQPISASMTIFVTSPDGKTTRIIKTNRQQTAREYTEVFTLPRNIEVGTHTIHLRSADGRIHTKVKLQISAAAKAAATAQAAPKKPK